MPQRLKVTRSRASVQGGVRKLSLSVGEDFKMPVRPATPRAAILRGFAPRCAAGVTIKTGIRYAGCRIGIGSTVRNPRTGKTASRAFCQRPGGCPHRLSFRRRLERRRLAFHQCRSAQKASDAATVARLSAQIHAALSAVKNPTALQSQLRERAREWGVSCRWSFSIRQTSF